MNFLKKCLFSILSLLICFTATLPAFANEETDNYNLLLEQGYPENFLDNLTDSALGNIVSLLPQSATVTVKCETKYWADKSAAIEDAKIAFKIVTAEIKDEQSGLITGKNVSIFWECLEKTSVFKEDYFEIIWNNDVFGYEPDSFYSEDLFKNTEAEQWQISDSYTALAYADQNSIGHWSEMKNNKTSAGGFMTFNLSTTSPIEQISDSENFITIDYTQSAQIYKTIIWVTLPLLLIFLIALVVVLKRRFNI